MQLYFNPVCFTKSRSSPRKSRRMSFKRVLKPNLQPRCIIVIRLETALKSCAANDRQTRETFSWFVPQKPWNRDVYRFRIANEGAVNDVHDTSGVFIYKETLHYLFFLPSSRPLSSRQTSLTDSLAISRSPFPWLILRKRKRLLVVYVRNDEFAAKFENGIVDQFHGSWKVTKLLHETEAKVVLAQLEKWKR